jgi:hypothetical protein
MYFTDLPSHQSTYYKKKCRVPVHLFSSYPNPKPTEAHRLLVPNRAMVRTTLIQPLQHVVVPDPAAAIPLLAGYSHHAAGAAPENGGAEGCLTSDEEGQGRQAPHLGWGGPKGRVPSHGRGGAGAARLGKGQR